MKRFTDSQFEPRQPPMQAHRPHGRSWWLSMFVSALLIGGTSVAILLPLGFFAPVIIVGGLLFFGMLGFHYVVWGRWVERVLREDQEAADED